MLWTRFSEVRPATKFSRVSVGDFDLFKQQILLPGEEGGSQQKRGYFMIFNSVSFCKFYVAKRRRDTSRKGARDRAKEVLFSLFCKCCYQTGQIDGEEELCFLRTLLNFSAGME